METKDEVKRENPVGRKPPSKENPSYVSCYAILSFTPTISCKASKFVLVKYSHMVSKFLWLIEMSSFLNMCPQSSYCFPNRPFNVFQTSFGVEVYSMWKSRSRFIDNHNIPHASSIMSKYFSFSTL
jgi:hypothetical protein